MGDKKEYEEEKKENEEEKKENEEEKKENQRKMIILKMEINPQSQKNQKYLKIDLQSQNNQIHLIMKTGALIIFMECQKFILILLQSKIVLNQILDAQIPKLIKS